MPNPQSMAHYPKLRELILYLAIKSEADPRFSASKLDKLLFACDFASYRLLGSSITGHSYRKLEHGPALEVLVLVLEKMKQDGDCVEIIRDHFGYRQKRVMANRPPDVSCLAAQELYLADQIVADLWESSASQVSELSHDFISWKVAAHGEVIPYETSFVGDPGMPVGEAEAEFCRALQLDE